MTQHSAEGTEGFWKFCSALYWLEPPTQIADDVAGMC